MKWTRDTASSPTFTPVLQDRVIGLKWFLLCVTPLEPHLANPWHIARWSHALSKASLSALTTWSYGTVGILCGGFSSQTVKVSQFQWDLGEVWRTSSPRFTFCRTEDEDDGDGVFRGSNCPQEKHWTILNNIEQYWTCWNWHAENGQNANPNLSDEFLTKIWCILKNCLKVLAFMSLWSRNMWVTKQSLGCRMTWTARWNQPSKDLRTAAATAATLTGWWFCILFRIKIWSDCHYLHGLKPPRKKSTMVQYQDDLHYIK